VESRQRAPAERRSRREVFDEGRDTLIERRHVRLEVLEVLPVRVPEAVGDGHATGAGFDQASSDEELVVPHRGAVAEVAG